MKLIELTQSRVAIVDDEDFKWLSKWKWHYNQCKKSGYAVRHDNSNSKQPLIRMHVIIMKRHKRWKRGKEVDHINTCGCDNRKENLRLATECEQRANQGQRSDNISGVVGVGWYKKTNKWRAYIKVNKKSKHLGLFVNKKDAIDARHEAEIKYFGEYRHDPTNVCPLGHTGQCPECAMRLRKMKNAT